MARYCVGASMEIDWGEEEPQARWDWCLAKRVFAYFRPYWRYGVAAIVCLAVGAALALVPAVVTKAVIDALAHPDRAFGRVLALILLGVGASWVGWWGRPSRGAAPPSASGSCSTCASSCLTGCCGSRWGSSPAAAPAT